MKIVVNAFSARLGGGRTYLENLFAHLPKRSDFEVLVFAPDSLKLSVDPRVSIVRSSWPTTNPLARAVWERFVLPGFLRRNRVEVLFCPGGVVGTRVPSGCKVVTMFRNMIPFDSALVSGMPWGAQRLRNLVLRRVLLRSLMRADLSIFVSNYSRSLIEGLARIPNPVTIPHGISDAFRDVKSRLDRPPAAPEGDYLLYVSRFDVYKHHREVIKAFAALPEHVRQRLHLVFLGETDMPEAEPVRRLVQKLCLGSRVLMPGAVPHAELPAWYRHAKAIIFASSCENCPNILLESLGAGRPVLASDVMPMPEFGGDGLIYFSPTDPSSLTRGLLCVVESTEVAQTVARAARARSQHYDWAQTAKQTWECIFTLAETRQEFRQ